MITEMLKRENVQIIESVTDWKDAIYKATQCLIDQGYITEQYTKTIIELTEKHGAYYVLCPDVALVHARPEDGVIKKQLAITLVKTPVVFKGKEDTVRLLITLAAEDADGHLGVLAQLADLLSDEARIEKCVTMENEEDLYNEFVYVKS